MTIQELREKHEQAKAAQDESNRVVVDLINRLQEARDEYDHKVRVTLGAGYDLLTALDAEKGSK